MLFAFNLCLSFAIRLSRTKKLQHQTPNDKHQTPHAQHQTLNTKLQAPNGRHSSRDPHSQLCLSRAPFTVLSSRTLGHTTQQVRSIKYHPVPNFHYHGFPMLTTAWYLTFRAHAADAEPSPACFAYTNFLLAQVHGKSLPVAMVSSVKHVLNHMQCVMASVCTHYTAYGA